MTCMYTCLGFKIVLDHVEVLLGSGAYCACNFVISCWYLCKRKTCFMAHKLLVLVGLYCDVQKMTPVLCSVCPHCNVQNLICWEGWCAQNHHKNDNNCGNQYTSLQGLSVQQKSYLLAQATKDGMWPHPISTCLPANAR